jgi:hypothetical protein
MISKVAIKINDTIYEGLPGERHDKVILAHPETDAKSIIGFVTDTGIFLNRKQAGAHAFECGQISEFTDCLLSEDVW